MMHVQIICVGKLKEKYWRLAVEEYSKRLLAYVKLEIIEVVDDKASEQLSPLEEQQVMQKEGARMLARLKPDTHLIALSIDGEPLSSESLATRLEQLNTYGTSRIALMIGGSLGLSDAVLVRANQKLSFGKMTYPHQLMRVILLEQLYRAHKIMRGEPYHK
jgi:23S rRNA (pseudouridine1915-N3)-methyltransferase